MAKIAFYTLGCKVNQPIRQAMENLIFVAAGISLSVSMAKLMYILLIPALLPIPGSANRARLFTALSARTPMR